MNEQCRLCMGTDGDLVWVFDEELQANLKNMIFTTVGVHILETEKIPQKICKECCETVIRLYEFRVKSAINNRQLKDQFAEEQSNILKTKLSECFNDKPLKAKSSNLAHPSISNIMSNYPNVNLPSNIDLSGNYNPYISLSEDKVPSLDSDDGKKKQKTVTEVIDLSMDEDHSLKIDVGKNNKNNSTEVIVIRENEVHSLENDDGKNDKNNSTEVIGVRKKKVQSLEIDDGKNDKNNSTEVIGVRKKKVQSLEIDDGKNNKNNSTELIGIRENEVHSLENDDGKNDKNNSTEVIGVRKKRVQSLKIDDGRKDNENETEVVEQQTKKRKKRRQTVAELKPTLCFCKLCGIAYYSRKSLLCHTIRMHNECRYCELKFITGKENRDHMKNCKSRSKKTKKPSLKRRRSSSSSSGSSTDSSDSDSGVESHPNSDNSVRRSTRFTRSQNTGTSENVSSPLNNEQCSPKTTTGLIDRSCTVFSDDERNMVDKTESTTTNLTKDQSSPEKPPVSYSDNCKIVLNGSNPLDDIDIHDNNIDIVKKMLKRSSCNQQSPKPSSSKT